MNAKAIWQSIRKLGEISQHNSGETVLIDGKNYELNSFVLEESGYLLCLLTPVSQIRSLAAEETFFVCAVFFAIGVVFIVWSGSVWGLVSRYRLTKEQKSMFSPDRIRNSALGVVLGGVLGVCVLSVFLDCLYNLHFKSMAVERAQDVLEEQIAESKAQRGRVEDTGDEAYKQYALSISGLLADDPGLISREGLQEICDIIDADYIMIYDENGNQLVTNSDFYGLSLGRTSSSSTYDFRRLLHGAAPIVHRAVTDEVTGLNRILVGACLPLSDGDGVYGALLASLGLATLTLSLGAKDLVTDILAGISIVFEGDYQVGDIIEVNGYRGRVLEVGVRKTKLEGRGGNIRIIDNRDVKNVINMTRKNSWYAAELNMSVNVEIDRVREIFEAELPGIGEQIPEIISGPYYRGVIRFGAGSVVISVIAECNEEDYYRVQRRLNVELQRLCERSGLILL